MTNEISCYNKGCGKRYDPDQNKENSCQYHPGVPVFHDALKGWSCCKKRSTDFTEFLNIPGCLTGQHSNEKPPEPVKPAEDKKNEVINVPAPVRAPIQKPMERPSENEPRIRLPHTVGASLKQALEKSVQNMSLADKGTSENSSVIEKGTSCKNNACKKSYEDESSNEEDCLYHPGVPIFHEGLKFWSCCQKKTTEFDDFLNQEGCTTGKHLWVKPVTATAETKCRVDWHQTGGQVVVSIFSKVAVPEESYVEANRVSLKIHVVFEGGKSLFTKDILLQGVIDTTKSNVKMLGTKVEINMKKAEPGSWRDLEHKRLPSATNDNTGEES